MKRRDFIRLIGGVAASPLAARAQLSIPVIGFVSVRSSEIDAPFLASFRRGLSELGFVEGQNIAIEYRYADGKLDRLPELVADLIHRQVVLVVTTGGVPSALAAKSATTTIPIVFTSGGDPVREGLVSSLNRPGSNLTGVTTSFVDLAPKRLEILREILRNDAFIGVLINPDDALAASIETDALQTAASSIGQHLEILRASSEHDVDRVFAGLRDLRCDAILVAAHAQFSTYADQLVTLAARYAIPVLYWRREFVQAGGLMSYGANLSDVIFVAGVYAARILKGARPGDLPVQRPTKFELVINLKTAKALGMTVPQSLIARADEVIE